MKYFIFVLAIFSTLNLWAAFEEEQRKYVFKDITPEFLNFINDGNINGLKSIYHSEYSYIDLYLDTEQKDLFQKKLSLRIRKRDFGNNEFGYGIQLKSEMLKHGDVRMEVEEDDLSFYKIVHNGNVYNLLDVLNNIFDRFLELSQNATKNVDLSSDELLQGNLEIIYSWIFFKLDSAVEPFIKLNRMNIGPLRLKTLRPIMIGLSQRKRSHIIIDKNDTTDDLQSHSQSTRSDIPQRIRGENIVWAMETSFDHAKFYSLFSSVPPHVINEYEVENKFLPADTGRALLERFEGGIVKEFNAIPNLESKYRQSLKKLLNM